VLLFGVDRLRITDDYIDFKSKKIRVNLNLPIKAEVKAESSDVLKTVDEDRKYVIQATIVRCVCSPDRL
jgi:hypothetical protein